MKAVILIVTQDWEALDGETQGNEIGRNGIFEKGGLVSATYFSKPQKTLAKDCIWLLKENLLLSTRGLEKLNDTQVNFDHQILLKCFSLFSHFLSKNSSLIKVFPPRQNVTCF